MNKNRLIGGLLLAIAVALLFSVYVYHAFKQASAVHPSKTQQIVVAMEPLGVGARLNADNIRTISWPQIILFRCGHDHRSRGGPRVDYTCCGK